jgi:hypothetical protein
MCSEVLISGHKVGPKGAVLRSELEKKAGSRARDGGGEEEAHAVPPATGRMLGLTCEQARVNVTPSITPTIRIEQKKINIHWKPLDISYKFCFTGQV